MADKYNGWTNYETWNVALWLDNDQYSESHWRSQAQAEWDIAEANATFSREQEAACQLAEMLKEEMEEAAPVLEGCYADLLGAALSEVNWHEIAEHYIADVDKETAEEEAEVE